MLASAIRDICKSRFSDPTGIVRSDTEWLTYINASYRLFCRSARWPALVTNASVAIGVSGRTATLSASAVQGGVTAVFDPSGIPLSPVPGDMPWKTRRFLLDQPSTPVFWEQLGDRISVLPAWSAGGTLTVQFLTSPTALTAGDTPIIPEVYQDALVAGSLARAYRDDGQTELAREYDMEFDAYVKSAMATSEAGAE